MKNNFNKMIGNEPTSFKNVDIKILKDDNFREMDETAFLISSVCNVSLKDFNKMDTNSKSVFFLTIYRANLGIIKYLIQGFDLLGKRRTLFNVFEKYKELGSVYQLKDQKLFLDGLQLFSGLIDLDKYLEIYLNGKKEIRHFGDLEGCNNMFRMLEQLKKKIESTESVVMGNDKSRLDQIVQRMDNANCGDYVKFILNQKINPVIFITQIRKLYKNYDDKKYDLGDKCANINLLYQYFYRPSILDLKLKFANQRLYDLVTYYNSNCKSRPLEMDSSKKDVKQDIKQDVKQDVKKEETTEAKKQRGRPKKVVEPMPVEAKKPKGRPKKVVKSVQNDTKILPVDNSKDNSKDNDPLCQLLINKEQLPKFKSSLKSLLKKDSNIDDLVNKFISNVKQSNMLINKLNKEQNTKRKLVNVSSFVNDINKLLDINNSLSKAEKDSIIKKLKELQ